MKECYQLSNPGNQTDCFEFAGGLPCKDEDCAVFESIKTDHVLRSLVDPADRESRILCHMLHKVCRIRRGTEEFIKRTNGKIPPPFFRL